MSNALVHSFSLFLVNISHTADAIADNYNLFL